LRQALLSETSLEDAVDLMSAMHVLLHKKSCSMKTRAKSSSGRTH
jgi:hypothetical protein